MRGLRECYRILKPGGVAFIGGGFGHLLDPTIREKLVAERLSRCLLPEGRHDITDLDAKARLAGIYRFYQAPKVGWWLELHKYKRVLPG